MTNSKYKNTLIRNIIIVIVFTLLLVLVIYFASARFTNKITGTGSAMVGKPILETRSRKF